MPDDLDLMQLAATGQLLARVDDVDYLAVQTVLAWDRAGAIRVYCAHADWAQTLPARIAAKEQEIAELAAGLDRYAAEATAQAQRAEAAERRIQALEQQLAAQAAPETPAPAHTGATDLTCCGKTWKSAASLQMHRQRAHEGMHAGRPRTPPADDQDWRCKVVGCSGAHARSILEPDFCTYHAKPVHQNGVETAALSE